MKDRTEDAPLPPLSWRLSKQLPQGMVHRKAAIVSSTSTTTGHDQFNRDVGVGVTQGWHTSHAASLLQSTPFGWVEPKPANSAMSGGIVVRAISPSEGPSSSGLRARGGAALSAFPRRVVSVLKLQ